MHPCWRTISVAAILLVSPTAMAIAQEHLDTKLTKAIHDLQEQIKQIEPAAKLAAQRGDQSGEDLIKQAEQKIITLKQIQKVEAALAQGNYQQALPIVKSLASKGAPEAQTALGSMYENGQGVPQDYAKAVAWYRLAADHGYGPAQNALGRMYGNGWGVQQDYSQAVTWFKRAATQGNAKSQFLLAGLYAAGIGVPQDFFSAYFWSTLAVAALSAGDLHDMAVQLRDSMLTHLTPQQIAEVQRRASAWRPILETRRDARGVPH